MPEKGDSELPTIRVAADEDTRALEVRAGELVWDLTRLETTLPPDEAEQVSNLKHKTAEEMAAVIREAGKFRTL
jgi:ribonuclease BN (tRNA processing enzyme)